VVLEELSKETLNFYAPRFIVEIGNKKLNAIMSKAIIDVSVEEKIDEGSSFQLTLHDEFDLNTQKFKWLDHDLFNVGNSVTIKMGYENDLKIMIMGVITSLEPSFFSSETPTIRIRGQDPSFDYLKKSSPARTFPDESYSEIAEIIAREAKLSSEVDDVENYRRPTQKDNNENYLTFLNDLKDEVGYELKLREQTLYFIVPQDNLDEILTLELGKDIISFHPAMNTAEVVAEVEVRGHNPDDPGNPIIGRAAAGSERSQESQRTSGSQIVEERHRSVKRIISNVTVNSQEHANSIARAALNRASDTFITGELVSIGISQIRAGTSIKLEKMGTRFSGKYYVTATTHTINDSGYRTSVTVKRNAL
jgi:phage protein D